MKESERLIAAKSLIDSPEKWVQGKYADTIDNLGKACQFCSLGAILKVRGETAAHSDYNTTSHYLREARAKSGIGSYDIAQYNDNHTHSEIMEMFDVAIQIAQAEGN